jgi:hypothetical protein
MNVWGVLIGSYGTLPSVIGRKGTLDELVLMSEITIDKEDFLQAATASSSSSAAAAAGMFSLFSLSSSSPLLLLN